jgi:hypothetical protein
MSLPSLNANFLFADGWAMIIDYVYWNKNSPEIDQWIVEHGVILKGMTLKFPDDQVKTLFALRWA